MTTARRYALPIKLWLAAEAVLALARARLILHRTAPADLVLRNRAAAGTAARHEPVAGPDAAEGCARIAFVIPRIAPLLPWRADCLVQALAGQGMLQRRGISSTITIGTAKHADGTFEAHAWLMREGNVILGGDISRFVPILHDGHN